MGAGLCDYLVDRVSHIQMILKYLISSTRFNFIAGLMFIIGRFNSRLILLDVSSIHLRIKIDNMRFVLQ
jgi:hypothetical protein